MLKKLTTLKVDDNQLTSLPNTIGRWVDAHTHSRPWSVRPRQEVTTYTFTLYTSQIQIPAHPSAAVFLGFGSCPFKTDMFFMMIGFVFFKAFITLSYQFRFYIAERFRQRQCSTLELCYDCLWLCSVAVCHLYNAKPSNLAVRKHWLATWRLRMVFCVRTWTVRRFTFRV